MKAKFKGLADPKGFEFVDVVPDGVNVVVSARWVLAWKVNKDGNMVKPKARLVVHRRFLGDICSYPGGVQC